MSRRAVAVVLAGLASEDPPATVPVDVYQSDGTRIFTGTIDRGSWRATRGAALYGWDMDPETQEYRVVRWRLEAPWENE